MRKTGQMIFKHLVNNLSNLVELIIKDLDFEEEWKELWRFFWRGWAFGHIIFCRIYLIFIEKFFFGKNNTNFEITELWVYTRCLITMVEDRHFETRREFYVFQYFETLSGSVVEKNNKEIKKNRVNFFKNSLKKGPGGSLQNEDHPNTAPTVTPPPREHRHAGVHVCLCDSCLLHGADAFVIAPTLQSLERSLDTWIAGNSWARRIKLDLRYVFFKRKSV